MQLGQAYAIRKSCTNDMNAPRPVDAHDGQMADAVSTVAIFSMRPDGSLMTFGASCFRES